MTLAVWAYSESEDVANELSSAANEIANSGGGQAFVLEFGQSRPKVPGKSKLVLKGASASLPLADVIADLIFRAAKKNAPSVILIGCTRQGREVASRLGAKRGTGCMSEAFGFSVSGQTLIGERNVYAGRVAARMSTPMPCVATVKVGAYPQASGGGSSVKELEVGEASPKAKLLETIKKDAGKVDLRKAKTIVSAGRGIKRKEDLPMLESLANALGGALGCSRPLSSDLGWLPEECHIGMTGVSVRPDLYLAVGISGQLQHVAGIKDSKIIAAINSDKDAPIFQAADYGVVGDLYQIIPALERALASRKH
jgi:electron transfer flavoprotein alpha subunit